MALLGLALGSGGARGFCHIGVLRALDEADVTPDMVAGCSMGALVGAAWAGGKLDALEAWARGLTRQELLQVADVRLFGGGLVRGGEIADLLARLGLPERIEDLSHPFAAIATDLSSGAEIWFREGPLADAVRSSVSIPGVFSPHAVGDRWMLDGGLVNPVPVDVCRRMGAELVLAVNPNGSDGAPLWSSKRRQTPLSDTLSTRLGALEGLNSILPDIFDVTKMLPRPEEPATSPNYFDVVSVAIDILTKRVLEQNLQRDPADVILNVNLRELGVLELDRGEDAIFEGHRLMTEHLDALKQKISAMR